MPQQLKFLMTLLRIKWGLYFKYLALSVFIDFKIEQKPLYCYQFLSFLRVIHDTLILTQIKSLLTLLSMPHTYTLYLIPFTTDHMMDIYNKNMENYQIYILLYNF